MQLAPGQAERLDASLNSAAKSKEVTRLARLEHNGASWRVLAPGPPAVALEPAEALQPARPFPAEVASGTSVFSTRAPHGPDDASTPVLLDR